MNRETLLGASTTALVVLIAWWASILYLDGALAQMLPYDQYELVALLYPDVYYPALPGWILAQIQPFTVGVWFVALGWMLGLSVVIGAAATRFAFGRGLSSVTTAAVFVVLLFVAATAIEAAAQLLI